MIKQLTFMTSPHLSCRRRIFAPFRLFAYFRNPITSRKWKDILSRKSTKNSELRENFISHRKHRNYFSNTDVTNLTDGGYCAQQYPFCGFCDFCVTLSYYCAQQYRFSQFFAFSRIFAIPSHRTNELLLIAKKHEKYRLTRKFYLTL